MASRRVRWTGATLLVFSTAVAAFGCGRDNEPWRDEEGVVGVNEIGEGCVLVEYQVEPAWECSSEQIRLATTSVWSGSEGAEGERPTFEAVKDTSIDLIPRACSDFVEMRRQATIATGLTHLESSFRVELRKNCLPTSRFEYFLDGEKVPNCQQSGGGDYFDGGYYDGGFGAASGGASGSIDGGTPGGDGDGAGEYSETNNQVAGVEEADYVKNDAGNLFLLTSNRLEVFDSWPVEQTKRLTALTFAAEPRRLLLAGDRLVVFLRTASSTDGAVARSNPSNQGCTYGYECRFSSDGGSTEARVYDVANPAAPRLLTTYEFSGGYVASRRIGQDVHVVVHDHAPAAPGAFLDLNWKTPRDSAELTARKAEIEGDFRGRIATLDDAYFLPRVADGGASAPCDQFLQAPAATGTDLITVATFHLDELGEVRRTTLATVPGFVYVSTQNLYLATDGIHGARYAWYDGRAATDISSIHRFALAASGAEYQGSAVVRGHVLNQFSMDEKDDVLRAATTSGWSPGQDVSSTVTTLGRTPTGFRRSGEITGIAPTEDIRSVRFDGDRGFVVTFKQTDPLFVFDLSEPSRPSVLGELKIPGFSTYMHPLDRDHLLAVGYDQSDAAQFDGVQVQVFDVTNLKDPKLLHKKVIGTRGSNSEALLNHLAFNYFAPQKVLALPITICEESYEGSYDSKMTFTGVVALDVDLVSGITERGRLPFASPDGGYNPNYGIDDPNGCFQWWSSASSSVKRTIFLDDYLFGLSDQELRAGHLDSLSEVLVSLPVGR